MQTLNTARRPLERGPVVTAAVFVLAELQLLRKFRHGRQAPEARQLVCG